MSSSKKVTKDRKFLEQHGIILSKGVYSPRKIGINEKEDAFQIPEYVKIFIEYLLDHDFQFPDSLRPLFEQEQQLQSRDITDLNEYSVFPPATAFFSPSKDSTKPFHGTIWAMENMFERAANLARAGRRCVAAKVPYQSWEIFLRLRIFEDFEDSALQTTSRFNKLLDAWTIQDNISWRAPPKLDQSFGDSVQPTFTYGFPVHVSDTGKVPTGFNIDDSVRNFSLNSLVALKPIVTYPVIYPTSIESSMIKGQPPRREDPICFPWALVQVQSAADESVEACYCRAAEAASAALDMRRQLHPVWMPAKNIPPVIFFTCSGPEVRVWVSYFEYEAIWKPSKRCICVWAGTLTATWCILALREIIQKMTFWASRVLKPQISLRISQILSLSACSVYFHGATPFEMAATRRLQALEDAREPKTEKLNPRTTDSTPSQSSEMFVFGQSLNAPFEIQKPYSNENDIFKVEKPVSSVPSGLQFSKLDLSFDVKTEKRDTKDSDQSKKVKPVSNIQTGFLPSEEDSRSIDAEVKIEKPHARDTNASETGKPSSTIKSNLLASKQKPPIQSSNASVNPPKTSFVWFRGRKIIIRFPSNDHRHAYAGDKIDTDRAGDKAVDMSGGQKVLQISPYDKTEGNKEVGSEPSLAKRTLGSVVGELKTKESPMVDAEMQDTPGTSYTGIVQSLGKSYIGVDDSSEAGGDIVGKYSVYRTNESFHARTYDATIWDSDDENDQSYATSGWGSEAESEGTDVDIEEDDADDEGSETGSWITYDDRSIDERLSELKIENEKADILTGPSFLAAPGEVRNLTLDDIDDLLYNAAKVISGEDFIQLKPIQTLLENLKGVNLLDATWRSLENWEDRYPELYSGQMRRLNAIVGNLNQFIISLDEYNVDLFAHYHLAMARRMDDLDQTLQRMQKKGDWRLRELLEISLKSWNGEKCMELLSNELVEMDREDFDTILREAFGIVYSDSNLLNTVM